MYLVPAANNLRQADPGRYGLIATPQRWGKQVPAGFRWLADNGCFSNAWEENHWLAWLAKMVPHQASCIMATLPDVLGDAQTTLDRFAHFYPLVSAQGWCTGLVGQDGLESLSWPSEYGALFIGGSTAWKLSDAADWCIKRAKKQGKWVHVGRVNGGKRIRHFKLIGVDSCDGTTMCFNPTEGFRKINNGLMYEPLFTLD